MSLQNASSNLKPTVAQIQTLEKLHKTQFADLVTAIELWHRTRDQKTASESSREQYGKDLLKLINKWQGRQNRIKAKLGSSADFMKTFVPAWWWFDKNYYSKLVKMRDEMDKEKVQTAAGTIGFIPLLIWAVMLAIAVWGATEVVDETNTTSEEQAELVSTTDSFCKTNNLSAEDCKALLTDLNDGTKDEGFGKYIFWGLGLFLLFKFGLPLITKSDGKKSEAA